MPRFASRNKPKAYRDIFPGTPKQAKRFQKWIKEDEPWLHPDLVSLWLAAELEIFVVEEEGGECIPIVREALSNIALDLQMVITSSLVRVTCLIPSS